MKRKTDQPERRPEGLFHAYAVPWEQVCTRVSDLVMVVDEQHRIIWANRAMSARFGVSPEGFLGRNCFAYFHSSKGPPAFCPHSMSLKDGEEHSATVRKVSGDGAFAVTTSPIKDPEGRVIATVHIAQDIGDRAAAGRGAQRGEDAEGRFAARPGGPSYQELEAALKDCEEKYRTAFEHSLIGLYRTTPDGRILLVNQALLNMLRYSSFEELRERDLEKHGFEPGYPRQEFTERIERSGVIIGLESAWTRKDGSTLYVRESARAIRDEAGKTVYYEGTVEDISERKEAEKRLRQLSSIVEQTTEGMALSDLEGNLIFVNRAFANMLGWEPEELVGKNLSVFHSAKQMSTVNAASRQIRDTGEFQGEIWHTRRDGSFFPSLMHNSLLRDEHGDPIGVIAVTRDTTEARKAAEDLRAAHEHLNATLNALPDLMFEVDRQGTILDFRAPNPDLLYRKPEEFLGRKVTDCLPKRAASTIMNSIRKAVRSGQYGGDSYSLEVGGKIHWFELSVAAKGVAKSADRHFITLVRDITDRKESENELRRTAHELKVERKELTEKNITLKQILDHIAAEKKGYRRRLSRELRQATRPHLTKLKSEDSVPPRLIEALEESMLAILEKESEDFEGRFARLTPREKEICKMIQNGLSSKEISEKLVVSPATVHKHREQIRKKLGITNKGINLSSYLVSSMPDRRT